jgi:acetyl esterase/lipase
MPAGIACNSPWLDITQSSPTWERDSPTPFDYLPKNRAEGAPGPKACDAWPASPPRKSLYVDDALATHPLVSVLMNRDWRGLPPIYMCTGWEILAREDRFLARLLAAQGATVVFEEYEAMPHCFAMILTWTPSARRCFDAWAAFIRKAVDDPAAVESAATTVRARSLEEVPLAFEDLSDLSEEQVRDAVAAKAALPTVEASAKL